MPGNFANYFKQGFGMASWAGASLGSKAMGMGSAGRFGMMTGAGALYGGTVGRDPGQSRLGGALSGAIGGAALFGAGRYGMAGYKATQRNMASRSAIASASSGWMGFGRQTLRMAGQGAFRAMRRDALSARRFIGQQGIAANEGFSRFTALHR